jgi:hypothetical protein
LRNLLHFGCEDSPVKNQGNRLIGIAVAALRVGRRCMRPYAHPKSPQKFTQPQLWGNSKVMEKSDPCGDSENCITHEEPTG